jgi:hypothetical protein
VPATETVILLIVPNRLAIVGAEPPFCRPPTVKDRESKYFDLAPWSFCSVKMLGLFLKWLVIVE